VLVSDDRALLDLDAVHAYLVRSYWSPGVPRAVVERAAANSLCLGAYDLDAAAAQTAPPPRPPQIGYARVVTDRATFAYLCDVYVLETRQGRGVGKLLMRAVTTHPDLQGLRRFMLMTRDAHGLYARFGFTPLKDPARAMEKTDPDVYRRLGDGAPDGPSPHEPRA
jgi:GNAT superfamily N-acetyltransferase